ncbi:MAG: GIY-YIG nuclease family protein [Magnetococcales bacterium]|nr:GIY-YIG nuclease family protein [Magnetococcales bacterium]
MATYVLFLTLRKQTTLTIGARGSHTLAADDYLYVGSAKRNWQHRVGRHLIKEGKTLRWHIDYILAEKECSIRNIMINMMNIECQTARKLIGQQRSLPPIPRIGSSDCRCPAHFLQLNAPREKIEFLLIADGFMNMKDQLKHDN